MVVAIVLTGCSFGVKAPRSEDEPGNCTRSRDAPVADLVVPGIAAIVITGIAVAPSHGASDGTTGDQYKGMTLVLFGGPLAIVGFVDLLAAAYGFDVTRACRKAWRRHDRARAVADHAPPAEAPDLAACTAGDACTIAAYGACTGGDRAACDAFAGIASRTPGLDPAWMRTHLSTACARGGPAACDRAAELLEAGVGGPADPHQAASLRGRARALRDLAR